MDSIEFLNKINRDDLILFYFDHIMAIYKILGKSNPNLVYINDDNKSSIKFDIEFEDLNSLYAMINYITNELYNKIHIYGNTFIVTDKVLNESSKVLTLTLSS